MSETQVRPDRLQAFQDLEELLDSIGESIDVVVVEGTRDEEAMRQLGFKGRVELHSRVGCSDEDLVDKLASRDRSVLVLTDFDSEGRAMNRKLTAAFERSGLKVEINLRRAIGRMMAVLGVYAIEDLENIGSRLTERSI